MGTADEDSEWGDTSVLAASVLVVAPPNYLLLPVLVRVFGSDRKPGVLVDVP